MEDWRYHYQGIQKEEWLRRIEADLNNSVESINSSWWPGENLVPVLHSEDLRGEIIRLPEHLFLKAPGLIHYVSPQPSESAETVNANVLKALQQGVQQLVFNITDHVNFSGQWLNEVHHDIIDIGLEVGDVNFIPEMPDAQGIALRFKMKDRQPDISMIKAAFGKIHFIFELNGEGNFISEASEMFGMLLKDMQPLSNMPEMKADIKAVIIFQPDTDFIKQLIQLRVIRVICLNLAQRYHIQNIAVETHIHPGHNLSFERYIMLASLNALASFLSGTNGICFHSNEYLRGGFYEHFLRNIYHLLDVESNVIHGTDPLSGSYTIDYHTKKWVNEIWSQLEGN